MELGEGPCLYAHASGIPVLLPDLTAGRANRWPAFASAALAVGVHAEFSLPLTVGASGIGTFDLCRDRPGMLSDEHLADALVAAQLDETVANALARLRAEAFASGRSVYDVAQDVVERRVRFNE